MTQTKLSESELQQIREEAKLKYPFSHTYRHVYIAALTAERERAKEVVKKASNVLLLTEVDGTPVDGFRFREMILELKDAINAYNKNKEV